MESRQRDPDFRHVSELLAAVLERSEYDDREAVCAWLQRLSAEDMDLQNILAREIERALPI